MSIKLLPSLKNKSYTDRLKILKLLILVYQCMRGDMIEVFKILNGYYDKNVSSGILTLHTAHNPRQNGEATAKNSSKEGID